MVCEIEVTIMKKIIKYKHCDKVNQGSEKAPCVVEVISAIEMGWSEANEEIAKREAYNGEYTVEEIEGAAT